MDCELSEEFGVEVGMHQGSVLSLFLFAVVVVTVLSVLSLNLPEKVR